uniref:MalT-like TPR region domain-containing protein n=1 Tax=Arundo donax TaxID=35708 RepID=A0A0A9D8B4_ARUDO
MAVGRRWDAVGDLQRALELKSRCLEQGSEELGETYRVVAEAYAGVLDFDKALPLCLKALEIVEGRFGEESAEVAKVRRLLMVVYTGLGHNVEALEQIELIRVVYERLGLNVELSQVEIDGANVRILLGRSEEAMNELKRVMQRSDKESEERALAYVTMAKILSYEERFGDSKRCLDIARGIIDTKDSMNPGRVAEAYAEISMLYESMTEFEMSLSLMKKALVILESASEMQHIEGSISARMGWLLLVTKRVAEGVPYLERAVDKLKNCFGPQHFGLGFAYKHLGQAYLDMDQHQSAVKFLTLAKDIINATFGPTHEDSIDINQSLANAYGLMGSYKLAMDFQEQVIDAYKTCDIDSSEELREAHRLLEQLRKKAQGSPSAVFPANALPLLPENNN